MSRLGLLHAGVCGEPQHNERGPRGQSADNRRAGTTGDVSRTSRGDPAVRISLLDLSIFTEDSIHKE